METKISIIIVNYNSGDFLLGCLNSIKRNVVVEYEVIVVDNDSSDDSFKKCRKIYNNISNYKFVESGQNLGFAKGNTIGVKYASGTIFHFLNPDTQLNCDINNDYKEVLSEPNIVYVNPLRNPDGKIVKTEHRIPTIQNYLKCLFGHENKWYIGASVIISKDNYDLIKGWSEDFWMYYEDLDFFYKVNKYRISIKKLSSIIEHIGGGCSSNVWSNNQRLEIVREAEKYFYKKNGLFYQYKIIRLIHSFRQLL